MDRFIEQTAAASTLFGKDLKSNMDRFIVCSGNVTLSLNLHLKSNMDRFIGYCIFVSLTENQI